MPNTTPNLGLIKPLVTEQYDIAKVTNENADILDLEVSSKQPTLVSGTNIKTINGNSVLGSGDVELLPKNNPIATGNIGLNSWLTFQRSFTGSGGTNIFESASVFGANVPTAGLLIVSELGTNKYYIGMLKKDNDAEAVHHFVISASGLSVSATNNSGTVAMTGFTNTSNVVMKSLIIKMT